MPCKVTNRTPWKPKSVSWNTVDQTHTNYLTTTGTPRKKKKGCDPKNYPKPKSRNRKKCLQTKDVISNYK